MKNEHNIKQEVGDDLNVCMLQLLPEASTLPSLVVIILVKAEIEIFQIVARPHFGHIVKASYGFKGGSLSQWVTTLPSLVSKSMVLVEI